MNIFERFTLWKKDKEKRKSFEEFWNREYPHLDLTEQYMEYEIDSAYERACMKEQMNEMQLQLDDMKKDLDAVIKSIPKVRF